MNLELRTVADLPRPVRRGDCYWLYSQDVRKAGILVLTIAATLLLVGVLGFVEPNPHSQGFGWVEIVAGLFIVLLVAFAGVVLLLRHPCEAVLDIAQNRVYRMNWRTGEPEDFRPTESLFLVLQDDGPPEDATQGGQIRILACGPEPSPRTSFCATLWTDTRDDTSCLVPAFYELWDAVPWKGKGGDPDLVRWVNAMGSG